MKENIISSCGLHCNDCQFFSKSCTGCYQVSGKTFWAAEHLTGGICPLYGCAHDTKKLTHCGECAELPCKTFYEMKDPSTSQEEHLSMIKVRTERLKSL